MITKQLKFDDDVLGVLTNITWLNDGKLATMTGQLDRTLYAKVNKALEAMGGKWNRKEKGHVFSDDPRSRVEGLLNSGALTVDVDGFFETQPEVVEKMIGFVPLAGSNALYLEPSCGLGAIMKVLVQHGVRKDQIIGIEQNEQRANQLTNEGFEVISKDFLTIRSKPSFDRVYMNPPFEKQQDHEHVMHAYEFLKDGGWLVSVMAAGVTFRDDRRTGFFRNWLSERNGKFVSLPQGSFKASGTGVNTILVVVQK